MDRAVTRHAVSGTLLRGLLVAATIAVAIFNGTRSSPFYDTVAYLLHLNLRGYPYMTARMLSDTATWPIALLTLMLAGVPAALYERIRGLRSSDAVSLAIWLAMTLLLTWWTFKRAFLDTGF